MPTPHDVERRVDALGRDRANALDEALAVGDRLAAQRVRKDSGDPDAQVGKPGKDET